MLRWPAKVAISWMSQLARARSVRHRCRSVWGVKAGVDARFAIALTTLDHAHIDTGLARFRGEWDRNSLPLSRLRVRRCSRYWPNSSSVVTEYGRTRALRFLVVSARTRIVRRDGSMSDVSNRQSSSR